jgi:hypothetical protein
MVFTGMQGPESRYQLEMEPDGLHVTDMATGQTQIASPVTKRKNSKEDRWYIQTENGKKYFGQNQIRASKLRMKMHERPVRELRKRNNAFPCTSKKLYSINRNLLYSIFRNIHVHSLRASCPLKLPILCMN